MLKTSLVDLNFNPGLPYGVSQEVQVRAWQIFWQRWILLESIILPYILLMTCFLHLVPPSMKSGLFPHATLINCKFIYLSEISFLNYFTCTWVHIPQLHSITLNLLSNVSHRVLCFPSISKVENMFCSLQVNFRPKVLWSGNGIA